MLGHRVIGMSAILFLAGWAVPVEAISIPEGFSGSATWGQNFNVARGMFQGPPDITLDLLFGPFGDASSRLPSCLRLDGRCPPGALMTAFATEGTPDMNGVTTLWGSASLCATS
jgi:hypothetical protein